MIGFAVQHPDGRMVHEYKVTDTSSYADDKSTGGYYNFCLYNHQHTFADKLVNIYLSSMLMEGWEKYQKEISDLHLSIKNFTVRRYLNFTSFDNIKIFLKEIIETVETKVYVMNQFQSHKRSMESRDMALLSDNNSYVQDWSIVEIFITILACTLQVYCVRKLFDSKVGSYKGPM